MLRFLEKLNKTSTLLCRHLNCHDSFFVLILMAPHHISGTGMMKKGVDRQYQDEKPANALMKKSLCEALFCL